METGIEYGNADGVKTRTRTKTETQRRLRRHYRNAQRLRRQFHANTTGSCNVDFFYYHALNRLLQQSAVIVTNQSQIMSVVVVVVVYIDLSLTYYNDE